MYNPSDAIIPQRRGTMNRREFSKVAVAASVTALTLEAAQTNAPRFRKGITSGSFGKGKPLADCFAEAKAAGFEGVEIAMGDQVHLNTPDDDLKRLADAAKKNGITIVNVWVSGAIADTPLNADDPKVRAQGVAGLKRGIKMARLLGTDSILVVPGEVGWGTEMKHGYETTWERVSAEMPKVIPDAERAGVYLNFEEVWNRFLTSPLDMRRFIDQFHSKHVAVHFDVGNIFQYGFPQDWIATLGSRIKRVHLKDYKMGGFKMGQFVPLLEGSVDWPAVMSALVKTGYRGFLTPEYGPNTPLKDISTAWDKIAAMAA
jgi:L-ribulose-5-phosphate 3-epimerase